MPPRDRWAILPSPFALASALPPGGSAARAKRLFPGQPSSPLPCAPLVDPNRPRRCSSAAGAALSPEPEVNRAEDDALPVDPHGEGKEEPRPRPVGEGDEEGPPSAPPSLLLCLAAAPPPRPVVTPLLLRAGDGRGGRASPPGKREGTQASSVSGDATDRAVVGGRRVEIGRRERRWEDGEGGRERLWPPKELFAVLVGERRRAAGGGFGPGLSHDGGGRTLRMPAVTLPTGGHLPP
ncbi:unnamed protein product [Urochloa humidicola]